MEKREGGVRKGGNGEGHMEREIRRGDREKEAKRREEGKGGAKSGWKKKREEGRKRWRDGRIKRKAGRSRD